MTLLASDLLSRSRDHCQRQMWRLLLCLVALVAGKWSALAQDRVILQQPGGSRLPLSGLIEDFTGRQLTIQVRTGETLRHYPRHEVIEIRTARTPHHVRGIELLADGKPVPARAELLQALQDEQRVWVRREILAQVARCALWKGDYREAASSFFSVVESDPETVHYDVAPLNWIDDAPAPELKAAARGWMAEPRAEPQLIGASHLLFEPDSRIEAEAALRKLARDPNPKVQRLAQMQNWRVRAQGQATEGELGRWEEAIDALPPELRAGGYFVLGQTLKRQQQPERAAALLLWLPLVYDADRTLAARACFDAAQLVESFGDVSAAANLYAEVALRFEDTPVGAAGTRKWKELTAVRADPPAP